ncbi:uncharacterized protein LOC144101621 [Amblyomma americanum]
MTSVANVAQPAALFRPPYYDVTAPPAYNFAALGQNCSPAQVIAQVMTHEIVERCHEDPAVAERWRRFWEHTDTVDADSIYCLRAGHVKNDTWRQTRLTEGELADRATLEQAVSSMIAYLAFLGTRRQDFNRENGRMGQLPGVELSSTQLFFVLHCALRYGIGGGVLTLPADQLCMVVYNTRKQTTDKPCAQLGGREIPNECRFI